jgi:glycosyltransferase involved in cell wall biosynthesis
VSRSPVSVVVVAGGGADQFRLCLESLRLSRDQHDEVVCVVPQGRDDLLPVVADATWLTVLQDGTGRAKAVWAAGVDATSHPVVVLLDGDVMLSQHWLEPVVTALADPDVVAAGPRCQLSAGPQRAEGAERNPELFKKYARRWHHQHEGQTSTVDALGPVCVAVRRDALAAVGGPGIALPWERLREHGRLVVTHESLVAHRDTARCALRTLTAEHGPFVSAVLVTRNEEETLDACLTAVRAYADEVVVYDLGSADRTRKIAEEHGARVVEAAFDGDYAAARNRAIEHAGGEWVLLIDADEIVGGDVQAARGRLLFAQADSMLVRIVPEVRSAAAVPLLRTRLFRWSKVRFTGRVRELAVDRIDGEPIDTPHVFDQLTITFPGGRPKPAEAHARNLRTDFKPTPDTAATQLDLARAAIIAGNYADAAQLCRDVLDGDLRGGVYEAALKTLMNSLIPLNELAGANKVLDELRARTASPYGADEWESRIRFAEGDWDAAVASARRLPESPDQPDVPTRAQLAEIEIKSLFQLDRRPEAADRLRDRLRAGSLPLTIAEMAEAFDADGGSVREIVALVPDRARPELLKQVQDTPMEIADELLDELWERLPAEHDAVVTLLVELGPLLPLHRALIWAARVREHGPDAQCPLLSIAAQADRSALERVLAAAVALERFADDDALPLLTVALDLVPDSDTEAVLAELREFAPGVAAVVEPAGASI